MKRHQEEPISKCVGIWIRVSTEDQVKGESPEHHEKRARHYAEAKGWDVREVYRLDAISGKSVMNQPETARMLKDIRSGRITGLVFSKLARLARNTRELLEFADIFREHEAALISLQESIDTSTPAGRLFYTMIAALAEWERSEIADRVAASVPVRAKLGKPLGGQAPYGYQYRNKVLVADPVEAPIRKRIYELFLQHRRKKTVARLLNESGYRTRSGGRFSDTTIGRLLIDPIAKGTRRVNYTKSTGNKKKWVPKPETEWLFQQVEPIISEEVWDQCYTLLNGHQTHRKPIGKKPVQTFGGLTYCFCGYKMYVPSNTPKYVCYKCRNKISVTDLEAVFFEQVKGFLSSPDDITTHLGQANETIHEKEDLLKSLEEEQTSIRDEIERVYRLYIADQITPDGYGRKCRPLEERLTALENEVPRLKGEIDFLKITLLSSDKVFAEAKDLYSRWTELLPEERREIAQTVTDKIVVGKEDINIQLAYLPSQPSKELAIGQRYHKDSMLRPE
jgi:site-specific DNA recombinase